MSAMSDKDLLELRRWREKKLARRRKHFTSDMHTHELNLVAMMDMMTILLVFLLKSYSVSAMSIPVGGEISVPMSTNLINPKESVKLTITKTGTNDSVIAVDDQAIVKLTPDVLSSIQAQTKKRNFLIPELQTALVAKADKIKNMSKLNKSVQFDRKILVLADKTTPYWLITSILFTSAESEFDQYELVALRQDQ